MTSLQNGNYNSRSMNGLTSIYANDINVDVVNTIDANVSNNLNVGGDFDISGNYTSANGNIFLTNGDIEFAPTTGGRISYNTGTRDLNIRSGTTNSKLTLDTYSATSVLTSVDINTDRVLMPQPILDIGPTTAASAARLQGNIGGRKGFFFTNQNAGGVNPASVPMGMVAVIEELMDLAVNCGNAGFSFNNARQGVQFRFDSRNTEKVFQIQTVERVTRTVRNAINALDTGVCEIPIRLDLLSNANMNQSGSGIIIQVGSGVNAMKAITLNANNDLTFQGSGKIDQSTITAVNNMGAITMNANTNLSQTGSGVIIQVGSGINLTKAITLNANNDLTFQGTGKIDQSTITGVNNMGAITMNSNTNLSQTGSGVIIQVGSGVNAMKAITLNANNDLTFLGSGKIDQSSSTGTNSLQKTDVVSTQSSTSTTTGALVVSGGVGIAENLNVGGTLSIPSYPNVKSTLDSLTTSLTGISYNAGTDTTTIDNNLTISANKNVNYSGTTALNLTGSSFILQSTLNTADNFLTNITLGSTLTFDDGTTMTSRYVPDVLNDADVHGYVQGRTIRFCTYNIGNLTNVANAAVGTGFHFHTLVRLVKGITYTGIGVYTGSAGSFEVALYATGLQPARLAFSNAFTTTANSMNYIPFATAFANGTTRFAYAAIRTTSAGQTVAFMPSNTYHNYGNNAMTNSTLNKRSQYYSSTTAFSALAVIPAGLAQINQLQYIYLVLYT